ncbi:MAG TPA: hypothetical protein VIW29_06080 [Polyangiaceae bacterium]
MLVLLVLNQLNQGDCERASVKLNDEQLKHLRELVREALEEAGGSQDDSGFWGDISDVLGGDFATLCQVVAIAAASVCTFGAAAVVLGAIAIACTVASKYAEELGIPPQVAVGLGIAAAVASVASGNVGGAAQGAAVAGSTAAQTGSQAVRVIEVAEKVRDLAKVGASAFSAAGAFAGGVSGYYAGEAVDYQADAQDARNQRTLTSMEMDEAIERLGTAIERRLSLIVEASQMQDSSQRTNQLILGATA